MSHDYDDDVVSPVDVILTSIHPSIQHHSRVEYSSKNIYTAVYHSINSDS